MTTTKTETTIASLNVPKWVKTTDAMPPLQGLSDFGDDQELHSFDVLFKDEHGIAKCTAYFNYTFNAWTLPDLGDFVEPKEGQEWCALVPECVNYEKAGDDLIGEMYDEMHDDHSFMLDFAKTGPYKYEVVQCNKSLDLLGMQGDYNFLINFAFQKHLLLKK